MKKFFKISLFLALIVSTPWLLCYSLENEFQSDLAKTYITNPKQTQYFSLLFTEQIQDSITEEVVDSVGLRDPNYAIFVALVPGAVVHGAGHFYAGKPGTGLILFGSELAGVGLMFLGGLGGFENGESTDGGDYAIFAGSVLFVGSWLYDIIESPMEVKQRNSKMLKQKSMGLEFRMKDAEPKLMAVWLF